MLLTETQREIRDMARDYAREKLASTAAGRDREHKFPAAEIKEMGRLGFLGMTTPETYGGSDVGAVAYACVLEEIAAGEGACSTILSVHNSVACGPIVKFGTEAQKQRFLPKLASGEWVGGFALSEPQAGSDAANLLTRAVRDGDHYVLTGTKQLITSGKNGNVIVAFAVTDPAAGKKGISAFIVPTDAPGYKVVRVEEKLGQNASDTCQIAFDEMRLPSDLLLGEPGEGYRIALSNCLLSGIGKSGEGTEIILFFVVVGGFAGGYAGRGERQGGGNGDAGGFEQPAHVIARRRDPIVGGRPPMITSTTQRLASRSRASCTVRSMSRQHWRRAWVRR